MQKFLSVQQSGKKEGGLGEGIFARLPAAWSAAWGGSGGASRVCGRAKKNLFPSLIEKNRKGAHKKSAEKDFALLAERRAPPRGGSKICKRIFLKKGSDFVQGMEPVRKSQCRLAEFTPHTACCCAGLGDQIKRDFGREFELAVFHFGKRNF